MEWLQAKDFLLQGLIVLVAGYVGVQLRSVVNSINELNITMARVLPELETHRERLDAHSERILSLEKAPNN